MTTPVRNVSEILPYKSQKYSIIIPAAGMGHRMNINAAKSLLRIGQHSLIERQILIINKIFPKKEIIVVGGYDSENLYSVLPKGIIRAYNPNFETTNVVESIKIGLEYSSSSLVVIIYGDLFFNKRLLSLPFRKKSFIVCSQTMMSREIGVNTKDDKLINLYYDLPEKWAQVIFLTEKEIGLLKRVCACDVSKMFGYECLNRIVDMGGEFLVERPRNGVAIDIDTIHDLSHIRKNYANSL